MPWLLILQREKNQVRVRDLSRARKDAVTALRILQGFPGKLSKTAFSILISDSIAIQEKSNYKPPACPHLKINHTCTRCLVFFPFLSSSPVGKCAVPNNSTAMLCRDRMSVPPEATAAKGHSTENWSTWPTRGRFDFYLGIKAWIFLELKRGKIPKANSYGVPYLPDRVLATFHIYYHIDPHHHPAR